MEYANNHDNRDICNNQYAYQALGQACAEGCVASVRRIVADAADATGVPREALADTLPRPAGLQLLVRACRSGNLDVVNWLFWWLGYGAGDVRDAHLLQACEKGLVVAWWLAARFGLTDADARAVDNTALRHACEYGQHEYVMWLTGHFGLTAADARAMDNYALRHACAGGHLVVAQWLADMYDLAAADARAANNHALRAACAGGHLATAQWLADHFGLGPADARSGDIEALRRACAGGHLDVAQWLAGHFGLGPADARAAGNEALGRACEGGHLAVAQWLADAFGLTAADIRASADAKTYHRSDAEVAVGNAGRPAVSQWLAARWPALGAAAAE